MARDLAVRRTCDPARGRRITRHEIIRTQRRGQRRSDASRARYTEEIIRRRRAVKLFKSTVVTAVFIAVNLVVDLSYGYLDPRIRLS